MRIGVFTVLFQDMPLEKALDRIAAAGISAVEIGTGGYPGSRHCPVDDLLASEAKRKSYRARHRIARALHQRVQLPLRAFEPRPSARQGIG